MSTLWKPIADAPKDGTGVFLRSKHFVSDFMYRWSLPRERWEGVAPVGEFNVVWDLSTEEPTHFRLPLVL